MYVSCTVNIPAGGLEIFFLPHSYLASKCLRNDGDPVQRKTPLFEEETAGALLCVLTENVFLYLCCLSWQRDAHACATRSQCVAWKDSMLQPTFLSSRALMNILPVLLLNAVV